jgi:hypothetical protein
MPLKAWFKTALFEVTLRTISILLSSKVVPVSRRILRETFRGRWPQARAKRV